MQRREARIYAQGHLYILRCPADETQKLVLAMIERTRQNLWPMQWLEVAIIAHQLGERDFLFRTAEAELKKAFAPHDLKVLQHEPPTC